MYCIRVNVSTEKYVRSWDNGSFSLCEVKSDAKKFASLEELLACTISIGMKDDDFKIVMLNGDGSKESAVLSEDVDDVITFERLAKVCEEGKAQDEFHPGNKIEDGYVIAAVKSDAVKIWSPMDCLGNMNWHDAKQVADNYYHDWNEDDDLPIEATSSELLSKDEAETMSPCTRTASFRYWTSTENISGGHWYVSSYGCLNYCNDGYNSRCCPGIWVRASKSIKNESLDQITFKKLHEICGEGKAQDQLRPGDKVEGNYVIVAVKPDSVKIWSPKVCLGGMHWKDADAAAESHARIWNSNNSDLSVEAISSELLSKEEAEALSKDDRMTGFIYWTYTAYGGGYHWSVDSDGSLDYYYNDYSGFGCCPGVWVR